jgi:hypothetical protein
LTGSGSTLCPEPVAYTSADLTTVRTAILRGERTVQFADRSVTYRSMDELRAVEQDILRELTTSDTRSKQTRIVASTGF